MLVVMGVFQELIMKEREIQTMVEEVMMRRIPRRVVSDILHRRRG